MRNRDPGRETRDPKPERAFFFDNILVRIRFIIVRIKWTGLAPWELKFPQVVLHLPS